MREIVERDFFFMDVLKIFYNESVIIETLYLIDPYVRVHRY